MAFIEIADSTHIGVSATYNDRHLVSQVPGSRYTKATGWRVPLTWASCVTLRGLFKDRLEVGPELNKWSWLQWKDRLEVTTELRDVLRPEDVGQYDHRVHQVMKALDAIEHGSELKLFPYQRVDVAFLVLNKRALLGNEPGLGKTGVVIRTLQVLSHLGHEPFPIVIGCPNSLKRTVWQQEFAKWAPEFQVNIVDGGAVARRAALEETADVYVLNWESLRLHSRLAPYGQIELTEAERTAREIQALKPRMVVFDEAHRAKDPHAKQTRASWAIADTAEFRVTMTGTPVSNHLGDLWSLLHLIEPEWFPTKTKFMERYALQTPGFYGGMTVIGLRPDTSDELFRIINPLIRRVPKQLALPQLPPKLPVQYRETPMGSKQAKAYKQMESMMMAQLLDGSLLTAPNPLSQLIRLTQFAAASAELSESNEVLLTNPSSKVDDLVDLLEEMGDAPLVVAAVSRKLIDLAAERLAKENISFALVTGAQSTVERQMSVNAFQKGSVRVILLTLGAGAEGITLTRADTILFMQRSYSVIQNQQAEDRVHRIGSEIHECVRVIEQVTPGTVEERRIELLAGKEERIQEIIRDKETMLKLLGGKPAKKKVAA